MGKWEKQLGKTMSIRKSNLRLYLVSLGIFFVVDFMCFLGNLSCKPFSVSKRTAQEELENIFLV